MKAIIPAAGLGTRFLPTTKSVPKELLPVLDKPVLQYVVEEALHAPQCEGIVVVKSPEKQLIEDYFSKNEKLESMLRERNKVQAAVQLEQLADLAIEFVDQDVPLGLGHAVSCAAAHTRDERFYVLLGDVIVPEHSILSRLYELSEQYDHASVIAVVEVPEDEVDRFGVIEGRACEEGVYQVTSLVEKPKKEEAPSRLAIFGRYLLSPRLMNILAHTPRGAGGEIQLTDALIELLEYEKIYAVCIHPEEGYDTGTIPNWISCNLALACKDGRYHDSFISLINQFVK